MAGAPAATKVEIPANPVHDTHTSGEELPDLYTRTAASHPHLAAKEGAVAWTECSVIDMSALLSRDSAEELSKLHSSLMSWGCFQLINHGITSSLMEEIREVSKQFFVLPLEDRLNYMRAANDPEGYGNDTILSNDVPHNWNDRLYLTVYPVDYRRLHFWPQNPHNFRELLHEFTIKVKEVHETILKAMARSLGLGEAGFVEEYGEEERITARINFYPRCPQPDLVQASRAHSDASAVTILLQDKEVEGLQVQKDEKWFKVPIIPHALFVNIGDQMEIMSNGIFKGAVHRVAANSERERISLAMFCSPNPNKEVKPLKELVNEDRPQFYKTVKRYGEIFFRYHPRGERPIHSVMI